MLLFADILHAEHRHLDSVMYYLWRIALHFCICSLCHGTPCQTQHRPSLFCKLSIYPKLPLIFLRKRSAIGKSLAPRFSAMGSIPFQTRYCVCMFFHIFDDDYIVINKQWCFIKKQYYIFKTYRCLARISHEVALIAVREFNVQ